MKNNKDREDRIEDDVRTILASIATVEVIGAALVGVRWHSLDTSLRRREQEQPSVFFLPVLIVIKVHLNNSCGGEQSKKTAKKKQNQRSRSTRCQDRCISNLCQHVRQLLAKSPITRVILHWNNTMFQVETIIHSSRHRSSSSSRRHADNWRGQLLVESGLFLIYPFPLHITRCCFNVMSRTDRSTETDDGLTRVRGHRSPELAIWHKRWRTFLCHLPCFEHRRLRSAESTGGERRYSESDSVQCKCHPLTRLSHRARHCSCQENGHLHLWSWLKDRRTRFRRYQTHGSPTEMIDRQ